MFLLFGWVAQCEEIRPAMHLPAPNQVAVKGLLGEAIDASHRGRLRNFINGPESKPIAIFSAEAAGRNFAGDWNGEHAGKWLYTASRAAHRSGDGELAASVRRVAEYLISRQEPNGYLGTYAASAESRMTSPHVSKSRTWDVWVHAYLILGLLEANRYFPDPRYVEAARKIGDLCHDVFVRQGRTTAEMGNHVGLSGTILLEPAVDLYELTRDPRYRELARRIIEQIEGRPGLEILSRSLKGVDLQQIGDGKIYQLLWNYVGIAKLFRMEGKNELRRAAEHGWSETVKHHLTLDGGPWGGIAAHHEVYNQRSYWSPYGLVETCSTMSWIHLNREMLLLTGEAEYAEEIEKTAYNSLIGAQDPNGEDWYYFSFPNGRRNNTYYWACCKSSGALALEELPPLMFGQTGDGISVNLYGESAARVETAGTEVRLTIHTQYPRQGVVRVHLEPAQERSFALRLRIPSWARGASVKVNQERAGRAVEAGAYWHLERTWRRGDVVTLDMPMPVRVERKSYVEKQGQQEIARLDYMALLRGPLVYATGLIDGYKREETLRLPATAAESLFSPAATPAGTRGPAFQLKLSNRDPIVFVPYYEAGGRANGHWRATWVQVATE